MLFVYSYIPLFLFFIFDYSKFIYSPCFDSFLFQVEDGIRDGHVTGVQTCALPISGSAPSCSVSCLPRWPYLSLARSRWGPWSAWIRPIAKAMCTVWPRSCLTAMCWRLNSPAGCLLPRRSALWCSRTANACIPAGRNASKPNNGCAIMPIRANTPVSRRRRESSPGTTPSTRAPCCPTALRRRIRCRPVCPNAVRSETAMTMTSTRFPEKSKAVSKMRGRTSERLHHPVDAAVHHRRDRRADTPQRDRGVHVYRIDAQRHQSGLRDVLAFARQPGRPAGSVLRYGRGRRRGRRRPGDYRVHLPHASYDLGRRGEPVEALGAP